MSDSNEAGAVGLTSRIVSAFVSNNAVTPATLCTLIADIHGALQQLSNGGPVETIAAAPPVPAVPVKKSITDDYLICLEDGKRYKSLRRHLHSAYGMTPDEYRAKWGLPSSYPMTAPGYSAARSSLAKAMGLGASRKRPVDGVAAPQPAPKKAVGRPRKKAA